MEKRWTWLVLIMIALVAFAGCSDDDDPVTPPPAKSAFETMAAAGAAYINSADCPGVISAADLNNDLASYTVIDIRRPEHYGAGHIPGAYNSSLGTLLDDLAGKAIPSDKPYVVACYSGQSAGHAKIAMELMYPDAEIYSLLFGMCSWSLKTTDSWDKNTDNLLTNPEVDNNNGDLVVNEFPALDGDAGTIVADRVAWMLGEGFQAVGYDEISANLDDYFIINYFGEDDYLGQGNAGVPGHIPGAYQFTPKSSLAIDQMLNNLPDDGTPIVVYCWTGQHSSQITAYLNMLGYEAYSLSFGSNSLFHDLLTDHQWNEEAKNDFAMEEGFAPSPAFEAMATAGADYLNGADCPGVINAADVYADLEAYTVIDIRAQEDYDAGHIDGAYHSTLGTLLADLETIPSDMPYVVACYTGQSAGHAKIAMELMYPDAEVYSLLFGMAAWSSDATMQGKWTNNTGNNLTNPSVENENVNLVNNPFPVLTEDPATVVADRVAAMLTAGFKGVSYTAIEANLEEYFIINYFGEADYMGQGNAGVPGHIPGAYQFTPKSSLGLDQMLANVPADMPVVVYCWTGQHSSQVTAYLNMLGYDAHSLTFGSNNLFYDSLTDHQWEVGVTTHDYPLVTAKVAVN